MRTCNYSEILRGSTALAGIPVEQLAPEDFVMLRGFHDGRLKVAWESEKWPDICPIEQRTFRAPWNSAATYAATTEVYDVASNAYYQSLVNGNTGNPPTNITTGQIDMAHWALSQSQYSGLDWLPDTIYAQGTIVRYDPQNLYYICFAPGSANGGVTVLDTTVFAVLTPFDRYIAYEQDWPPLNSGLSPTTPANPIAEFLQSTHADPRITTKLVFFHPWISEDGAQYTAMKREFMFVWLKYRLQRPLLTGDYFNNGAAYEAGQQMYYWSTVTLTGNFYTATGTTTAGQTPDSTPSAWSVVQIPYIFRDYMIRGGYADWLISDGQGDKFAPAIAVAQNFLELEADKLFRQQQNTARLSWAA